MHDTWEDFLVKARPNVMAPEFGHVLTLDPGLTTGWARWMHGRLVEAGQWATPGPADMADAIHALVEARGALDRIVYEEYRIRGNKFKEHVGSEVVTIQNIGAIKVAADELSTPLWKQGAGLAKGFATDSKLRGWGLWQTGLRHANDAIRHGVYWHLFVAARSRR